VTPKQQKFVDEYLQCFNATEAARRAGYNATNGSLAVIGYENLRKPNISEAIKQHFQASAMSSDEALKRLGDMARADMADFVNIEKPSDLRNLPELKGKTHLIKKLKRTSRFTKDGEEIGTVELELHDSQSALNSIGKHHAIFTDRVEHSGEVTTGPINIIVNSPDEPIPD
jgi:phage terminase small subunit